MTRDALLAMLEDRLTRGDAARRLLVEVAKMRAAQRAYFQDRSQANLLAAKGLEAKVDAGLDALRKKPR